MDKAGGQGRQVRGQREKKQYQLWKKTDITLPASTGGTLDLRRESPNGLWCQGTRRKATTWDSHILEQQATIEWRRGPGATTGPGSLSRCSQAERAKQEQRGQQRGKRQAQIQILRAKYFSGGSLSARKFLQTNSAAQVKTKKKKKKRKRRPSRGHPTRLQRTAQWCVSMGGSRFGQQRLKFDS